MPANQGMSTAERQELLQNGPDYEKWTEVVGKIEEIRQVTGWSTNKVGRLMGYAGTGLWSVLKGRNIPEKRKVQRLRFMYREVMNGRGEELTERPIGASATRASYKPTPASNGNSKVHRTEPPEGSTAARRIAFQKAEPEAKQERNQNRLDLAQQELNVALRAVERMQVSLTKELEVSPRILKAGITLILNETETVKSQLNDLYRYFGE